MKKVFATVAIVFTTLQGFSQEKISSYTSDFFEGKQYAISASENSKSDGYNYYIDVSPRESVVSDISLSIDTKEMVAFKKTLAAAKQKYMSWSATAKKNNITTLDKSMDGISYKSTVAYLYGSKWKFDYTVKYLFRAKILDNQMYLIIQNKHELVASDNQYITCKGFLLVFSSEKEIDDFVAALDVSKAKAHFDSKKNKEDLFQ